MLILFTILLYHVCFLCVAEAQLLEGIYCGKQNCYDVLEITREAAKTDISKNYRRLAKLYHPDLHRDKEAKEKAEEQFKALANAYEILKDDESRMDYDYMLDNPDEYYAHYYRYYKRRVAPKVDVRIAGRDIAKQEGVIHDSNKRGSRKQKISKEEMERIIKKVIEEKMDIKGAYAKPKITDLLWIQLLILPYTVISYIYWYILWIWRHNICQQPFSEEEKLYIIRKYLKMGENQFNSQEEGTKQEYLNKELWIKEKFEQWFKEQEEETKKQLAENNRYKQYRRYVKNHGIGRMTFDDS
ncbi:hypothetical protein GWI33_022298 [Rhynchophorus ferrugineus]|uniref:J domain-containing protein n=1 Tax=Rhynchophorus ferrugineus TaxID=354439 RepID=A0A834IQ32_RHYFE|nr:hypothetical protein GWI33_022298 [Rhynchophorus ferrugineus]